MDEQPSLRISTARTREGRQLLRLMGVLDIVTHRQLATVLTWAIYLDGTREVLIDLAGLEFMDVCGVRALVEGARLARSRDITIRAGSPQKIVDTVLRITGVADLIHLEGDLLPTVHELFQVSPGGSL